MKKLASLLLAALTALSLASCRDNEEATRDVDVTVPGTSAPQEQGSEQTDTAPVSEEAGAVTSGSDTTTSGGGSSHGVSVTAGADTEKPGEEGEQSHPVELDTQQLLEAAIAKMDTMASYNTVSDTDIAMSFAGENINTNTKTTSIYKKSGSTVQYFSNTLTDAGEGAGENDYLYYTGGYCYDVIGKSAKYRQKMNETQFKQYQSYISGTGSFDIISEIEDFGELFSSIKKQSSGGVSKITFSGPTAKLNTFITDTLSEQGLGDMVTVEMKTASGEITINGDGYITDISLTLTVTIKMRVSALPISVPVAVSMSVKTTEINSVGTISFPSLSGFTETTDMLGLRKITDGADEYNSQTQELKTAHDNTVRITGALTHALSEKGNLTVTYEAGSSILDNGRYDFDASSSGTKDGGAFTSRIYTTKSKIISEYNNAREESTYNAQTASEHVSKLVYVLYGDADTVKSISSSTSGKNTKYSYTFNESAEARIADRISSYVIDAAENGEALALTDYKCTGLKGYTVLNGDGDVTEFCYEGKVEYTDSSAQTYSVEFSIKVTVE